jgi:hypothetical protein
MVLFFLLVETKHFAVDLLCPWLGFCCLNTTAVVDEPWMADYAAESEFEIPT